MPRARPITALFCLLLGVALAACGADPVAPDAAAPSRDGADATTDPDTLSDVARDLASDGTLDGPATARFSTSGGFVRDEQGRALVLRGVNLAHTAKRSPDGLPWAGAADVARLRTDFGFNALRLTLFWRWVEPERGTYDRAYLARVRQILDWAADAELHVVLDLHQDLFGFEATDSQEGDGPPAWAQDPTCPPFLDQSPWFVNYFSEPVACQFRSFYANRDGVQDAFRQMWTVVAGELGGHPAVIGCDPFNEPWLATGEDPEAALGPFYEQLIPAVRKVAPGLLVFYEPGTLTGSIIDQVPRRPPFEGLVYAPHFYPSSVSVEGSTYQGDTAPLEALLARHLDAASEADAPLWIGEYGASETLPGVEAYYRDSLALFGERFVGFARWSYDAADVYPLAMLDTAAGRAELPSTTAMIEPYAERIPGVPKATRLDRGARRLELDLEAPQGGELVIACPPRFCGDGTGLTAEVAATPDPPLRPRYDGHLGQVRLSLPALPGRTTVRVSW